MISLLSRFPSKTLAFCTALAFYGVFGSPTPDTVTWVEWLIGGLFLFALYPPDMSRAKIQYGIMLSGFSVPTVTGMIHGVGVVDMFRDIIPFIFFFLPLVYVRNIFDLKGMYRWVLLYVGICFAVRGILPYAFVLFTPSVWGQTGPADLLYLANSPEVLFAGIFLVQMAFMRFIDKRTSVGNIGLFCLSLVPLLSMALMVQRAGVSAFILSLLIFWALMLKRASLKAIVLAGFVAVTLLMSEGVWGDLAHVFWQKNIQVGENGRFQEWQRVWHYVSADWMTWLFGMGWGFRFENPAVGEVPVTYTHSLVSFLLLKTGLIGTLAILSGIGAGIFRAFKEKYIKPVETLALFIPLLIAVFLYASYKSLGFGLILCAFYDFPEGKLDKAPRAVA